MTQLPYLETLSMLTMHGCKLLKGEVLIQPHTGRLEVASHSMTCDRPQTLRAF